MRVFRYILRFLGISATLLWLFCSFARAQDNNNDVTVNFPDEMTVSGQVEITNLGITGDPVYDDSPFPGQIESTVGAGRSGLNSSNLPATTYLGYQNDSLDLFNFLFAQSDERINGTSGSQDPANRLHFNIYFPSFNWTLLKKDFTIALFGNRLGISSSTGNPSEQSAIPFIGPGRGSLQSTSSVSGQSTVVTDQIGNGTWSINFSWDNLAGVGLNSGSNIDLSAFSFVTFKSILNFFLSVVMWYECIYLIVAKVSQG